MLGYIGEVRLIAADFAPKDWFLCHGQTLKITDYSNLFSVIGTIYGGDGHSTFQLPDTQSRVVVGAGTTTGLSTYPIGNSGGIEQVTLNVSQMPAHKHTMVNNLTAGLAPKVFNDEGDSDEPEGNYLSHEAGGVLTYSPIANDSMGSTITTYYADINVADAGLGTPHNNIQPVATLHYIICYEGLYPSRG